MKLFLCCIIVQMIACSPLSYGQELDSRLSACVRVAEELMDAKLYDDAITTYKRAIRWPQSNQVLKNSLTLRLGQIHLLLGEPELVLEELKNFPMGSEQAQAVIIKALSYIYANQPKQALTLLDPSERAHALLYAMAYESMGDHEMAIEQLRRISSQPLNKTVLFAKLFLAKIALVTGAYKLAHEELEFLVQTTATDHLLYPEILWLRGVNHYLSDNISQAIRYFEKALELPALQAKSCYFKCIDQLSQAYLTACNSPKRSLKEKESLLSRAEERIQRELIHQPNACLSIALARVYLAKTQQVQDISMQDILGQHAGAEASYLKSLISMHLYETSGKEIYLQEAMDALQKGLQQNPNDTEKMQLSLLLGKVLFLKNAFSETELLLAPLAEAFPFTSMAAESLYWCGRAAEKNPSHRHKSPFYYKKCYSDYPLSSFAAEAFFRMYSYQEYLQGDREAKKHLEGLRTHYPHSHYGLDALFLLGLDSKRDRKTAQGKWINKGNMTKAIDQFQQLSTEYQRLNNLHQIPAYHRDHYSSLELRAILEKALCNLTIARQSQGAKKYIYLQYAAEIFTELIAKIGQPDQNGILEEAMYALAQTHLEAEQYNEAEELFHKIIQTYERSKVTRGYYLSRSWHDLSTIALAQVPEGDKVTADRQYAKALLYLQQAEECAKGRVLSTDQTIDLWLKMSHCYKMMEQYDQAMRYLTKAIDEDAISALRLKAMYLRAEIYELQERHELARKQLDALSTKRGEWAEKAKEKLIVEKN